MNCDRIAASYWLFESLAFGRRLQCHRVAFLEAADAKRRALILGDGDGRFTEVLAASYPNLEIHSVELSAGMIAVARKRLGERVNIAQGDVLQFSFPPASYDIVFTHFFLDCFPEVDLGTVAARVSKALTAEATWVISDFRQAKSGWQRFYTKTWLFTMYLFFSLATGLQTRTLPDYQAAMNRAGFSRRKEQISRDGLIVSQWWQR